MKKLIPILMGALFLSSCEKKNDDCKDPSLILSEVACTMEYDPVCGCDGETYPNPCVAKFQHGIKKFTQGACACEYPYSGKVIDKTGLDGCELMIELDNGQLLEPVQLPGNYQLRAGTKVELDFRKLNNGSYCMAGEVVEVTCIREVGCLSITMSQSASGFDDPLRIKNARIDGDCLLIQFDHAGGCEPHNYQLNLLPFCGTPPVPPPHLELQHGANGDACEALINDELSFDLTKLQKASQSQVEFFLTERHNGYNEKFTYSY